uniref:Uncharacterized protein n=1 Tax=Glossina palpalis gambiensis TaxID=67801 RepID=A0A1B0BB44_9MUSC
MELILPILIWLMVFTFKSYFGGKGIRIVKVLCVHTFKSVAHNNNNSKKINSYAADIDINALKKVPGMCRSSENEKAGWGSIRKAAHSVCTKISKAITPPGD